MIKSVNLSSNASLGATESLTLAWRLFQTGVNSLSFKAKVDAFDDTWGVTDLLVKTSTVIDLDVGNNLYKDYGYYEKIAAVEPQGWTRTYSTEDYQTRLYATFDNSDDIDKILRFTGWDIDTTNEISVF